MQRIIIAMNEITNDGIKPKRVKKSMNELVQVLGWSWPLPVNDNQMKEKVES